jgi:MFS family permease
MRIQAASANRPAIIPYLGATGFALWALVMALAPDPGFHAPWPWLSLFWALQITVGLIVLQATLYLMGRADQRGRMPLWSLVVMSGFMGAAVLTPLYWLIGEGLMQQFMGFAETIDTDELISLQQKSGWAELLDEWLAAICVGGVVTLLPFASWELSQQDQNASSRVYPFSLDVIFIRPHYQSGEQHYDDQPKQERIAFNTQESGLDSSYIGKRAPVQSTGCHGEPEPGHYAKAKNGEEDQLPLAP